MFADPPPVVPALEPAPPRWTKGDVTLGILAIAGVLGLLIAVALVARPRGFVGGVLGTLAFEVALALVPLALARRRGISLRALGFVASASWWSVLGIWLATYVVLIGYAVLLAALDGAGVNVARFEGGNPVPLPRGASWPAVLGLGATVVLVAPVAEELYFRAFLFRAARPRLGVLAAALLSGVLFSLFHANLAVVLPFALVGALFAWGFEASGSLWTSIVAHFLVNGAGFAATIAQLGGDGR